MEYVKLLLDENYGNYSYQDSSSMGMFVLGVFLARGVRCSNFIYREWALADKEDPESKFSYECSANVIFLEEEGGYVYLTDKYSEEKTPTRLKTSKDQFVKLLDDWQEKVCKLKPKEVIIKHDSGKFVIETN